MTAQTHHDANPQGWSAVDLALRCLLIEEEQHRLSNNLQLIISNFERQAAFTSSKEAKHALSHARDQVAGLGRLHNMLRRPEPGSNINCSRFLSDLCLLVEMLITAPRGHDLVFTMLPGAQLLAAEAQQVHLLGIITYELLTNAAKHAFNAESAGSIHVDLAGSETQLVCTISDNGHGRTLSACGANSKGMQYIGQLADQARGACSWHFNANGTRAQIILPLRRPADMAAEPTHVTPEALGCNSPFSIEAIGMRGSRLFLERLHPGRLMVSLFLAAHR